VVNRILERTPFAQGSLEFAKQNVNFFAGGADLPGRGGNFENRPRILRG
jgi:hypothetical protein